MPDIIKSFYSDAKMDKPYFEGEADFNELYAEEVRDYIGTYNDIFLNFEETKIQEMILQDFYYIYFPFSDDTVGFFGNPVCELTYNQLKLIVYTKLLIISLIGIYIIFSEKNESADEKFSKIYKLRK